MTHLFIIPHTLYDFWVKSFSYGTLNVTAVSYEQKILAWITIGPVQLQLWGCYYLNPDYSFTVKGDIQYFTLSMTELYLKVLNENSHLTGFISIHQSKLKSMENCWWDTLYSTSAGLIVFCSTLAPPSGRFRNGKQSEILWKLKTKQNKTLQHRLKQCTYSANVSIVHACLLSVITGFFCNMVHYNKLYIIKTKEYICITETGYLSM